MARRSRPHWHIDVKWISGLLLILLLGPALLVVGLAQATAEKPAVETLTTVTALLFSRKGLDDETEIQELRQRLKASPDGTLKPIPGMRIVIREKDIANLSPRQVRLYFFGQLAKPLYKDGTKGLAALAEDPEMTKRIPAGIGPLAFLSLKTHQKLQWATALLTLACLILLASLIFFSSGFGRLGNPGFVILLTSFPGAALFTLLNLALKKPPPAPPQEAESLTGMLGYMAYNALPPTVGIMFRNYLVFLSLGVALMVLAILGKLVWWLVRAIRS